MKQLVSILFLFIVLGAKSKELPDTLFVAHDNSGQYTTITQALESLPMYCYERVVIYLKSGIYNEKIKIDRDYVSLVGENSETTRIEFSQLRETWNRNPDVIGPAVVNIFADDVILKNLTIENTQPAIGPHAFAIYGTGTRTILLNCNVLSKGGDTVSLWNYKTGMYYHNNCFFQGAVDFVCPRGWCYISNSTFYELKNTAAIWHAAPTNPNQKFVLQNCSFESADSFYLARHHYDAQFYFLSCRFPALMRNKAIEHVTYPDNPEKNRPYLYGDRYFFYNCSRNEGNFPWFADNLNQWPKSTTPDSITVEWTFDRQWNPVDSTPLQPLAIERINNTFVLTFNELVMATRETIVQSRSGKTFKYFKGNGRHKLEFRGEQSLSNEELNQGFFVISGTIQNIQAMVHQKKLKKEFRVKVN
ncbi:MAG: pectinesterase family protein [Salinivirgaceae bacterium]